MFAKAVLASIAAANLFMLGFQAPVFSQKANTVVDKEIAAPRVKTEVEEKHELSGYYLTFNGRALPVKQTNINNAAIMTAPIISQSLPVNISGFVRPGLNELSVDFRSDPKSSMTLLVERRTAGPKKEELAKIVLTANQSKGAIATEKITFNLPSDQTTAKIESLSDDDKKAIAEKLQSYWAALNEHKADKLKAIYKSSLDEERKLCPESASFFEKILNREASVLRNQEIKLEPLDSVGLNFKIEGDKVKLYRDDKKPLVVSNEVDVQTEPVLIEVQDKDKHQVQTAKSKMKERIVKYYLYFRQNSENGTREWSLTLPPNA